MATLNSGLGGSAGYGENSVKSLGVDGGNLDDGHVYVDISSVFSDGIEFFGSNYSGLYVNTNGIITLEGSEHGYQPSGLAGYNDPAIAPFWSDVNISDGGDIYWDLDPSSGIVTITWLNVEPYANNSATNSFQVVLSDQGNGNFNIDFIYGDISWSNGGYGVATGGITDGGSNDWEVPGSGNSSDVLGWDTTDLDGSGPDPGGTFSLGVINGQPTTLDGTVHGEDTAELMDVGYDDADGASDGGGDQITNEADLIDGAGGDDTIDGGGGADSILGGDGDDSIHGGDGVATVPWVDVEDGANLQGTSGTDYFRVGDGTGGVQFTIRFENTAGAADGDGVVDYLFVDDTVNGHQITIGDFDAGIDQIVLTEAFSGISSSNTNFGGYTLTEVQITYANGNQQTFDIYHTGTFDSATFFTTMQPASVDTGSNDDTIDGGDGADTIAGGAGADSLVGGGGDDTFLTADGFGSDTIIGGESDESLGDILDLSQLTGPVTITYTGDEAGTVTDGVHTLTFSDIERLILTDQDDVVDGSSSGAADYIDAGDGDDTLDSGGGDDTLDGGRGNDLISGGAGDDLFLAGSGHDTISDFNAGNTGGLNDGDGTNNDFIDLSGHYDNLSELYADQADDGVLNQSNTTDTKGRSVDYSDNTQFDGSLSFTGASADSSFFTQDNTGVVCFTKGTLIATTLGPRPVELLKPGDFVLTRDNGPKPLIWVGARSVGPAELAENDKLKPVWLHPVLIGADRPVLVSRQHGMLMRTDGEERLVRAIHLARAKGGKARIAYGCRRVTYFHLMCEAHEILFANGAPTESFYPGEQAIGTFSQEARDEVMSLFSDLPASGLQIAFGPTARIFHTGRTAPRNLKAFDPV